jgi:hypothetical protein
VSRGRFIYLAGADGTGKTTQARILVKDLQSRGIRCRHLWLRFPFFFSLPLLAYARWRGYSWHEVYDGIRYGYWDFKSSRVMRTVFPWVFLFDATLAALVRVHLSLWQGVTIVCERFVLDMLVDLVVALDDPTFHQHPPGTLFLRLLPNRSKILILHLDVGTIRQRRPELEFDKKLAARLEAYGWIASVLSLPQLSSAGPLDQITFQISTITGQP